MKKNTEIFSLKDAIVNNKIAINYSQEYRKKLESPKWQKKRLEILSRDEFKCKCCGNADNKLNIHHIFYPKNKQPWEIENYNLITLCDNCHELWHYVFDSKFSSELIYRAAELHEEWQINDLNFILK